MFRTDPNQSDHGIDSVGNSARSRRIGIETGAWFVDARFYDGWNDSIY